MAPVETGRLIAVAIVATASAALGGAFFTAAAIAAMIMLFGEPGASGPIGMLLALLTIAFPLGLIGVMPAAVAMLAFGLPIHSFLERVGRTQMPHYAAAGVVLGLALSGIFLLLAVTIDSRTKLTEPMILAMLALPPFFGSCVGSYVFGWLIRDRA